MLTVVLHCIGLDKVGVLSYIVGWQMVVCLDQKYTCDFSRCGIYQSPELVLVLVWVFGTCSNCVYDTRINGENVHNKGCMEKRKSAFIQF